MTQYTPQAISGVSSTDEVRVVLFINNEFVHAPIDAIIDSYGFPAALALKANLAGGNTLSGVQTLQSRLALVSGQISFPATQVPSTDVNTLDDYEEGTFTPALAFGGASTGITYGSRSAEYVKIGKFVYVSFSFVLTSKGSATGNATITGMPFAPAVQAYGTTGSYNTMSGLTSVPVFAAFSTTINIRQFAAASNTAVTDSNFTNTTTINGSITFMVA